MALLSFLDREHTIAPEGYSRWLVPPAALAIHLSIGQQPREVRAWHPADLRESASCQQGVSAVSD